MVFRKGEPNPSQTPEARKKLSERRRGQRASIETRKKRSETMKKLLKDPAMRKKWSEAKEGTELRQEVRKKMRETRKKRPMKLVTMLHYMDQAFSVFIRMKYADSMGYAPCFTCDAVKQISEMDCGHFVSRVHKATRWTDENAHPQCRYCNRYCEGRKDVYALKLVEKYGPEILSRLQEMKHQVIHIDLAMYEQFMAGLKQRRENLAAQMFPDLVEKERAAAAELKTLGVELPELVESRQWWRLPQMETTAAEQAKEIAAGYERVTLKPDYT